MKLKITSHFTKKIDTVVDHLASDTGHAYVFTNSKALSYRLTKALEAKIDKSNVIADVIHVHGSLDKTTKSTLVKISCGKITIDGISARVLVSTSASDMGLDNIMANLVVNFECPDCIPTLAQRRGRGSRRGQPSVFELIYAIGSITAMLRRIYRNNNPANNDNADDDEAYSGKVTNGLIPNSLLRLPRVNESTNVKRKMEKQYALTATQREKLVLSNLHKFYDMLSLIALDSGCINYRLQIYLANGTMPPIFPKNTNNCGRACPRCSGEWSKQFRSIREDGLGKWFKTVEGFPSKGTVDNLVSKIWTHAHWVIAIFDRAQSTIHKHHIEALLCQLIAAKLIGTEWKDGELVWILTKEDNALAFPNYLYEDIGNWKGLVIQDPATPRIYPLDSIKNPANN